MSLLANWVQTPAAMALVWTLVHSLWQGAIVALALSIALCVIRESRVRYLAACAALVLMLGGFGVTFATLLAREQGLGAARARKGSIRLAPLDPDAGDALAKNASRGAAEYLPWLSPFWIAGVLIFHVRSLAGWMGAHRLRRTGVCCAPDRWQQQLERLAARLRISRPVMLWESCLADVPLVIGFLRPVILMPVGLLAGLPAAQIEALLLHELAHIRRHDYLVNLLQVFVEGLVFYHPAVWWIAAVIRAEREHCCDDLVVATQGDAYQYCTALAALEQARGDVRQAALAANGGSLVKRIRRLLSQSETPRSVLTPVLSAAVLTVTAVGILAAWQTKPPAAPPAPHPAQLLAQVQQAPDALPEKSPYRQWLNEDVAYIIFDAERAAFKGLQTDEEREFFIMQFWLRRDPTPATPENEFKEEHYRRIAYANGNYSTASGLAGWKTDRGRIYITYGPPNEKETHPSGGKYQRPAQEGGGSTTTFPFEQWLYRYIEGVGKDVIIEFVDPAMSGEYRMTTDPSAKDAMMHVPGAANRATVQILGSSAVISVPVGAYQKLQAFARLQGPPPGRGAASAAAGRLNVSGRILSKEGAVVATFEDTLQAPATNYVKTIPLTLGTYKLELVVKDLANGNATPETLEFEVK